MFKHICSVLTFIICIFGITISAQDIQSLRGANLSTVEIDDLTDQQIVKFFERAQESGLTEDQLAIIAQQRGMSSLQISKLRARFAQIQLQEGSDGSLNTADRLRSSGFEEKIETTFFEELVTKNATRKDELQIFGSDIFMSEQPFESSPNVATPSNYILGPGDELIIDIYGASETTYREVISPDGKIAISGVGPISVSGISIDVAKARLFNKLSSIYSGLKGSSPNTYMELSLGTVRTILVDVVGNAKIPGTYPLSSFSTAFNAVYVAGGPSENGSMRHVEIRREGELISTLDIYTYFFKGDNSSNPSLKDGDVIVIKTYQGRVTFDGAVKNPAIYELIEGETVDDLLDYSGGFSSEAFEGSINISRKADQKREIKTVSKEEYNKALLVGGDEITVSPIIDRFTNRVSVEGAVLSPAHYQLTDELTLSELIKKAQGLREDAYLKRGNIIRLKKDFTLTNISFDINAVLDGSQDYLLQAEDVVFIPSIFDVEENKTITVQGEVRNPGEYPYVSGMTVEDLLNVSGGLKESANVSYVEIARRVVKNTESSKASEIFTVPIDKSLGLSNESSSFKLEPFDVVLIKASALYKKQNVIKIEGEVMYPGYYSLESDNDKLSDIISRAGGLTSSAYPKGAILIRRQFDEGETTDVVGARNLRNEQLKDLIKRDSINELNSLSAKQEGVGIELEKALINPDSKHDLILQDGDLLSIPSELQTVRILGEVLYPTNARFDQSFSFKKYVSLAGGFSDNAKVSKAYILYANGRAQRTKRILFFKKYPKVEPGADLIIPQKPEIRKLSAQEIIGITSSIATLALVIDRLSQ